MRWALGVALLVAAAGCLSPSEENVLTERAAETLGPHLGLGAAPQFTPPVVVDHVRAGGEPVIAVLLDGTLVVSGHPGYTHAHPSPTSPQGIADAVAPTVAQSYIWRSIDNGSTWSVVGQLPETPAPNRGPHGGAFGAGDPEFTYDASTGRIWFTDLAALAQGTLSWSDDGGATWTGNNLASGGPMDRQWLASHQGTLYFTGNYLTDRRVLVTEDGETFERRGEIPDGQGVDCGADVVADPRNGWLYAGCGDGMAVSVDEAATWTYRPARGLAGSGGVAGSEPAVDTAGNVYLVGRTNGTILIGATKDQGQNWTYLNISSWFPELAEGRAMWPWISAGSEGRAAVTFMGTTEPDVNSTAAGWFLYNVIVINATSPSPEIYPTPVTADPMHVGPVCMSGTTCQARIALPNGDRRLGDFFETTIDRFGVLHVVYPQTTSEPGDTVSHVSYARLASGPSLVVGPLPPGFPTQG